MRLHHLEITAFGPFCDTVRVDLDELSDAGLFLLSGPTGAGKTSVLDAVCFALYGDVPGDRSTAKRLRSDHAAPGVAPRVVLEATLSGRRFRLERSPAWERPKKRGEGTTTEQACVTLSERVDGAWRHLSSRLDETGHLVDLLVGMSLTQFTQVAMLPQGRFQTFLRARSEERHAVLQQLFRTGRFADVERWLRDRRVALRRQGETAHQEVADLVSRISETAGRSLPEGWDVRDLTVPAASGDLGAWVRQQMVEATTERQVAQADAVVVADREQQRRTELEETRARHARVARLRAARAEQVDLAAAEPEIVSTRTRVDAARRAAGVAPLLRLVSQAEVELARRGAAVAHLEPRDRDEADRALEAAVARAAEVAALQPTAARLVAATTELGGWHQTHAQVLSSTRELRLRSRLAEIDGQVAVLRDLGRVTHEHDVARQRWHDAREQALARQSALLDLREARLQGMAGEIALGLAVGACCPVCGSDDHPAKARPSAHSPDAAAEKAALRALDDAKATEHLRDVEVRDLDRTRAALAEQAGDLSLEELRRAREVVESELAPIAASGPRSSPRKGEELATRLRELEREDATAVARIASLTAECAALRASLDDALADTGCDDLDDLSRRHAREVEALRGALRAIEAHATATTALEDARRELGTAVTEAGFDDAADASAAVLGHAETARLADTVIAHERRVAAVTEVLREVGDACDDDRTPLPDLAVLGSAHTEALAHLGRARGRLERATACETRLGSLVVTLDDALERWAPLREDLDVTARLAAFVEGKAPDNRLRMRLSAYVLAYRLGQVVAAANVRLASMSDQRYSLVHSGDRGAGETRGGLSLLVRDDWSGETRDPATLSGGETFVVSLALALGLADVITQEVGGASLDTLFVDEGFGSLDSETLDDVMDTLDALRDGGRVVGVVSHVAELRDRIPTQLVVSKARSGSTLSLRR